MYKFCHPLKSFARTQTGAVTVDYVPLVAGIIGLGVLVVSAVAGGVNSTSHNVSDTLANAEVTKPAVSNIASTAGGGQIGGDPLPGDSGGGSGAASGGGSGGSSSGSGGSGDSSSDGGGSSGGSSGGTTGADNGGTTTTGSGNPGNDKNVGNAGENPNGNSDWGGGSVGNSDSSGNPGAGSGGGGSAQTSGNDDSGSSSIQADFTFPTANIGFYWGDTVVSDWMSFPELGSEKVDFSISGDGNATAQAHNSKQLSEGKIQWGTNIVMETPPPGQTYTVVLQLGDQIGTFSVTRAANP